MRLALFMAALAVSTAAAAEAAPDQQRCWIATWTSSQQVPEPHNALPLPLSRARLTRIAAPWEQPMCHDGTANP